MSHLSGSFSHPSAGRLLVVLSADFTVGSSRFMNYGAYLLIRGFVGPTGALQYVQGVDARFPVSVLETDYPGGNVVWQVGTETQEVQIPTSGVYFFGASNISMKIRLTQR